MPRLSALRPLIPKDPTFPLDRAVHSVTRDGVLVYPSAITVKNYNNCANCASSRQANPKEIDTAVQSVPPEESPSNQPENVTECKVGTVISHSIARQLILKMEFLNHFNEWVNPRTETSTARIIIRVLGIPSTPRHLFSGLTISDF
ncbi:hypothetical protein BD410DRAFT_825989 [Rickenella mellea]|uniref:Uncharacterized protein n=1 Tax=Rickenella mellea TaxID=50990 RepID=A0A4Y7QFZ2_9AGAM|nr:hypothetical protein BD410DRAFT_825989 [Rickenella mellea]